MKKPVLCDECPKTGIKKINFVVSKFNFMDMYRSEQARKKILDCIYNGSNAKVNRNFSFIKSIDNKDKNESAYKIENLFVENQMDLDVLFAKEFFEVGGRFVYCNNEEECYEKLKSLADLNGWTSMYCRENILSQKLNKYSLDELLSADLHNCQASITTCEFLVARTGSVVISSFGNGDRTSSAYAPIHICIAYNYQLVYDLGDVLSYYKKSYLKNTNEFPSFFSVITGPSKTADIEKTLVRGVHGPEDIYIFFIDQ